METLLATKIFIPLLRPGLVVRPRLLERLQFGLQNNLVLVSAPPGFGKTTLLSQWVNSAPLSFSTAWVSLGEEENDPLRFWDYFISALRTILPEVGETALSWLHSQQTIPIQSVLTLLINDLARMSRDLILVLQDYHFIQCQPIHNGVAFLLDHMPARMHLVIATRVDPPLPLAHYRGNGTILEIGTNDLRFTHQETNALFAETPEIKLTTADIKALNTRSEGWAAGLKMALLSLRGENDVPGFVASFTGSQRYIMDYLIEEVLHKQPEEIQDFLLQTSVVEKMSGSLCDAITGQNNGQETLVGLERSNLFIVPLDESRRWFRYQHLFAELLRHHLETTRGKDKINEIHKNAAKWYEINGMAEDAVNHALAAQDWEGAMRLLANPAIFLPRWHTLTMYNWLRVIPEEILRKEKYVCLNYVWALELVGQYASSESNIKYLENQYPDDNHLLGMLASVRASIAVGKGDLPHIEEYSKRALALLPADDTGTRALISMLLGMHYINKSLFNESEPFLAAALASLHKTGDISNATTAVTFLALIAFVKGKLNQAEQMFKEAIRDSQNNVMARYFAHVYLGMVYCQRRELSLAARETEDAVELYLLARGYGLDKAYLYQVRVDLAKGDIEGAKDSLEKATRVIVERGENLFDVALLAGYRAMLALAQDDALSIADWIEKLSKLIEFLGPDVPSCTRRLLYAREGRMAAIARFERDYIRAEQSGFNLLAAETRVCQAILAADPKQSIEFLSEALTRGKLMGVIGIFADQGKELIPPLKLAIAQGIETEFARKLLDIIETEERRRKERKGEGPASLSISEPLSERELEVLKLLAEDMSNGQIAFKLSVSLSTVKTHVHHILDKLEVKTRNQAVFRARELKLI